jgi:long-chain fatty acid transport protein
MAYAQLRLATLASASLIAAQSAFAGGFDRGAGNIELLFDPARVATEAGVTYVNPQRELKDVQRATSSTVAVVAGVGAAEAAGRVPPGTTAAITPLVLRPALTSDSIDIDGDYAVPRLGAKFNLFEPVDCLASYTQPYGADAYYGKNNAYSISAVEFNLDSDEFALTCSYKFDLGKGSLRAIGGVTYNEINAFFSRQTLLDFGNEGVGEFDLSDDAWSYRIGAAYEIPEIAFRASLLYSGKVDLNLEGTVDTRDFGPTGSRLIPAIGPLSPTLTTGVYDVDADTEIPQALEFRLQSGIAEGTIAFGSVRWQDWSQIQRVLIGGVVSPTSGQINPNVSFDAFYEDGWTITTGVGHKFNDAFSGLASITWDKGTSTFQGFQSDTYSVALGGSYSPNKNVEFRLGGSVGVLTGGRSDFTVDGDPANLVSYTYDADIVAAGSASIRVKF